MAIGDAARNAQETANDASLVASQAALAASQAALAASQAALDASNANSEAINANREAIQATLDIVKAERNKNTDFNSFARAIIESSKYIGSGTFLGSGQGSNQDYLTNNLLSKLNSTLSRPMFSDNFGTGIISDMGSINVGMYDRGSEIVGSEPIQYEDGKYYAVGKPYRQGFIDVMEFYKSPRVQDDGTVLEGTQRFSGEYEINDYNYNTDEWLFNLNTRLERESSRGGAKLGETRTFLINTTDIARILALSKKPDDTFTYINQCKICTFNALDEIYPNFDKDDTIANATNNGGTLDETHRYYDSDENKSCLTFIFSNTYNDLMQCFFNLIKYRIQIAGQSISNSTKIAFVQSNTSWGKSGKYKQIQLSSKYIDFKYYLDIDGTYKIQQLEILENDPRQTSGGPIIERYLVDDAINDEPNLSLNLDVLFQKIHSYNAICVNVWGKSAEHAVYDQIASRTIGEKTYCGWWTGSTVDTYPGKQNLGGMRKITPCVFDKTLKTIPDTCYDYIDTNIYPDGHGKVDYRDNEQYAMGAYNALTVQHYIDTINHEYDETPDEVQKSPRLVCENIEMVSGNATYQGLPNFLPFVSTGDVKQNLRQLNMFVRVFNTQIWIPDPTIRVDNVLCRQIGTITTGVYEDLFAGNRLNRPIFKKLNQVVEDQYTSVAHQTQADAQIAETITYISG